MFMEFATGVEGSTAYLCYFNKKRLIKILHSWGINDFREFLKNYIWYDTDAMMCEFEDRGWSYKKVACEFQSEKESLRRVNKMEILTMYSLYDCDEWRSTDSMTLEFETLDRKTMNAKIREIIREIFDDCEDELADKGIDVDSDDLVEQVQNQAIDYLYLEVREINPQDKTVEIVGQVKQIFQKR